MINLVEFRRPWCSEQHATCALSQKRSFSDMGLPKDRIVMCADKHTNYAAAAYVRSPQFLIQVLPHNRDWNDATRPQRKVKTNTSNLDKGIVERPIFDRDRYMPADDRRLSCVFNPNIKSIGRARRLKSPLDPQREVSAQRRSRRIPRDLIRSTSMRKGVICCGNLTQEEDRCETCYSRRNQLGNRGRHCPSSNFASFNSRCYGRVAVGNVYCVTSSIHEDHCERERSDHEDKYNYGQKRAFTHNAFGRCRLSWLHIPAPLRSHPQLETIHRAYCQFAPPRPLPPPWARRGGGSGHGRKEIASFEALGRVWKSWNRIAGEPRLKLQFVAAMPLSGNLLPFLPTLPFRQGGRVGRYSNHWTLSRSFKTDFPSIGVERNLPTVKLTEETAMTTIHCTYCRRALRDPARDTLKRAKLSVTRDHITPRSKGGRATVPCCRLCNHLKADLPADAWRAVMSRWPDWWRRFRTHGDLRQALRNATDTKSFPQAGDHA